MAPPRPDNAVAHQLAPGSRSIVRLLSVLTVIGVLVGVAGLLVPRALSYENSGDAGVRKEIVSRTTDFAIAYNTYDVADVDDYQQRLKGLLSTGYYSEFEKVTTSIFKGLEGKKQVSKDAKVLKVAVEDVSGSKATAIVAVDAAITNTDVKAAVARHLRWKVSLVEQDGDWNIDKFEAVGTLNAETGAPTPAAPTPTGGADK